MHHVPLRKHQRQAWESIQSTFILSFFPQTTFFPRPLFSWKWAGVCCPSLEEIVGVGVVVGAFVDENRTRIRRLVLVHQHSRRPIQRRSHHAQIHPRRCQGSNILRLPRHRVVALETPLRCFQIPHAVVQHPNLARGLGLTPRSSNPTPKTFSVRSRTNRREIVRNEGIYFLGLIERNLLRKVAWFASDAGCFTFVSRPTLPTTSRYFSMWATASEARSSISKISDMASLALPWPICGTVRPPAESVHTTQPMWRILSLCAYLEQLRSDNRQYLSVYVCAHVFIQNWIHGFSAHLIVCCYTILMELCQVPKCCISVPGVDVQQTQLVSHFSSHFPVLGQHGCLQRLRIPRPCSSIYKFIQWFN